MYIYDINSTTVAGKRLQNLLNATTATGTKALDATQKTALYAVTTSCSASFTYVGAATGVSSRDFDMS